MLKNFLKYQSLGNDIIVLDWYRYSESCVKNITENSNLSDIAKQMCNRRLGIGADSLIILKNIDLSIDMPEILVFNSDGSKAEICMNGLRCVALHLYTTYDFPLQFKIKAGQRIVNCHILKPCDQAGQILIKTDVGLVDYLDKRCITTSQGIFCGHVANVGNPHFVILEHSPIEHISTDWLEKNGSEIEKHDSFENKTNVEFVWQKNPLFFDALVYERGCGITPACSSGAAAIAGTLLKLGLVTPEQTFKIGMPGGEIECNISNQQTVCLSAQAKFVFSGSINWQFEHIASSIN